MGAGLDSGSGGWSALRTGTRYRRGRASPDFPRDPQRTQPAPPGHVLRVAEHVDTGAPASLQPTCRRRRRTRRARSEGRHPCSYPVGREVSAGRREIVALSNYLRSARREDSAGGPAVRPGSRCRRGACASSAGGSCARGNLRRENLYGQRGRGAIRSGRRPKKPGANDHLAGRSVRGRGEGSVLSKQAGARGPVLAPGHGG